MASTFLALVGKIRGQDVVDNHVHLFVQQKAAIEVDPLVRLLNVGVHAFSEVEFFSRVGSSELADVIDRLLVLLDF